ncbi:hypothetical protein Taro_052260 [Colocasia esculenta]|uniref:Pentatricopeptide repeat-containing protein n=1 Tax=Colocasia esculenta TaxID=4460 RepID=A0A843XI47_COLES|nr:hypothetical protein [Colocasia esculenta]
MVFDKMASHDTASWNIMIGFYALRGDGVKVMATFSLMHKASVAPDEVTFVNVLSGCSHAGIANEGREILDKMESEYNVVPTVEHYACVVDMLGRAGRLMEAYNLAVNVRIGFSPVVWRAYLTACQIHGDMDQSVHAARRLLEMEPEHCGSYVLLSNAYGSASRHGDVLEVRKAMRHRNVRKAPGCSWIELGLGMQII